MQPLTGKLIAVTGAARGIGLATARALVDAGAKVAMGDLDRAEAIAAANTVGVDVIGLELDVTSRDSFASFLDRSEKEFGPLYGLINNAGIMPLGPFLEETDVTANATLDVDLSGVILGCKLALPRMLSAGSGHIANVASVAGRVGTANTATYCAAKHGVVGLTEALRIEFAGTGVAFSYVLPAAVQTDLGAGVGRIVGLAAQQPDDVAAAIVAGLRRKKVDIWVPRRGKALALSGLIAPRGISDRVTRALGGASANVVDPAIRHAHDTRIPH